MCLQQGDRYTIQLVWFYLFAHSYVNVFFAHRFFSMVPALQKKAGLKKCALPVGGCNIAV